ncbi:hypothetical protein BCR33DRAFT_716313, partial [Rhizoclosmatium globosum]
MYSIAILQLLLSLASAFPAGPGISLTTYSKNISIVYSNTIPYSLKGNLCFTTDSLCPSYIKLYCSSIQQICAPYQNPTAGIGCQGFKCFPNLPSPVSVPTLINNKAGSGFTVIQHIRLLLHVHFFVGRGKCVEEHIPQTVNPFINAS